MIFYIYLAAVILASALHLWMRRRTLTPLVAVDVAILYLLVFFTGVGGLVGALGHTFHARQIALSIGWAPGSPFQFEVAMANLAFGVLGILCIWRRGDFWLATALGWAIFLLGCAYGHIRNMLTMHNDAVNNVGPVLWLYDLAVPLTLLALLAVRRRLAGQSCRQSP